MKVVKRLQSWDYAFPYHSLPWCFCIFMYLINILRGTINWKICKVLWYLHPTQTFKKASRKVKPTFLFGEMPLHRKQCLQAASCQQLKSTGLFSVHTAQFLFKECHYQVILFQTASLTYAWQSASQMLPHWHKGLFRLWSEMKQTPNKPFQEVQAFKISKYYIQYFWLLFHCKQ